MTEELEQLLKNLKLRRILEIYDEQARAAEKEDVTYSELVTRLVRAQFLSLREKEFIEAARALGQRGIGHRVAAVLDHDDLAVQGFQPRQRFGQHRGLGVRGEGHEL